MHPLVGLHLSGSTLTALDDVESSPGHLGRPIWNARMLLGDLELRLGLPRNGSLRSAASRGLRVQQWSQRLAALVHDSSRPLPYFAEAYHVDPTGTAARLLQLRDALIEAGWDGEPLLGAERLETLSALEALEGAELAGGHGDRLAAVEAELSRTTRSPYVALDLVDELALWPGRWRRVFERLRALGTRIQHARPSWPALHGDRDLARFQRALRGEPMSGVAPAGDGSLVLVRAATSSQLAEPTAALLAADPLPSTVIIRGLDPGPLDEALARHGLARQGVVGSSCWRPALQLLRLALSVAFVPRDPRRVLELSTLPAGPFAGRSGRRLAEALCDRPGIGNPEWSRALQELSAEERARVEQWIESPRLDPNGAPREALLELSQRALAWLTQRAAVLGESSFHAAAQQARAFIDALRLDRRARLDRTAVEQLLQDLTEEGSTSALSSEEAGRLDAVDSPERLLVPRDRVVWWGCVGEPTLSRPRFRAAELEVLRRAGLFLPEPDAVLRARFEAFVRALHAARRQLVLVMPEQVASQRCEPHPLLDELIARWLGSESALAALTVSPDELARGEKIAATLARPPTELAPLVPLPPARPQWQLDPTLIRARAAESASSLEKLIGCPLQWTLEYQAGLRTTSRRGLASGPLLYGKLGHRLLEELHHRRAFEGAPEAVRQHAEEAFERLLELEGATLLTAGASDEKNQLKSELVEAAVTFAALLHERELELVGVEVPVTAELAGRPLQGRIDVVLRTRQGEERVLDLKYGSGAYAERLKQGHALQLAIYAEARRRAAGAQAPPPAAYFSLKSRQVLATKDAAACFQRPARPGPSLSTTGARMQNTLAAITATFEAGRVPVAGVQATAEAGLLHALGVASERAADHVALTPEGTCRYCAFGAVCGRSWEQPW